MRKANLTLWGIVFPVLCLFWGCEKQEMPVDEPSDGEIDPEILDETKQWFDEQTGGTVFFEKESRTKSSGAKIDYVPLIPDWNKTQTDHPDEIISAEVPVFTSEDRELLSGDHLPSSTLKEASLDETPRSRTRFVVQKDKETGETRGFMMTVIPDEEYIANGGTIDSIDYYHRSEDFSGLIVFNHLKGGFANAWKYKEGKIQTGYLPRSDEVENKLKSTMILTTKYCNDVYASRGGYTVYNGRHCWSRNTYVMLQGVGGGGGTGGSTFDSSSDGISTSGGGGTGVISSSSGGYIEPLDPIRDSKTPFTDDIAKTNLLDTDQTELLEQALEELIERCSDGYIYNELVADNKKFIFKMDSNLPHPAGYDASTKTFKFRDNDAITSGKLKEEFFHAFQDSYYSGGISQYENAGKVNIEFEAKLYTDISNVGCCIGFNMVSCPQKIKDDYLDWIIQLRKNPSGLTNTDYQQWLKLFNTYTSSYSSSLASNLSDPDVLKSIISNSKCY